VSHEADQAVADAFRTEWGRVVATLIRLTGDWDLAEECAQDAFARALENWPRDGVPRNPGAWITTVARNRALDRLRRDQVATARLRELASMSDLDHRDESSADDRDGSGDVDDRLRLMYTCCHPALSLDAQVALTLRTLVGLQTNEIARAFLVPEPTLAQRLVRAKRKIRNAGIPFRIPPAHQIVDRTRAVLAVLYLLYNEGYAASVGQDLIRCALTEEAVNLARTACTLMPDEPEALGLLALMLFQDSRRHVRLDPAGDIVLLEDQDRSRWDNTAIAEATAVLNAALRLRRPGPYQVQAAIAACHAQAARPEDTDWEVIAALYGQLMEIAPSPVVELNRAVAVSLWQGPAKGLDLVEILEARQELRGYHLLPAARADMLRRLGRHAEAASAYREALTSCGTEAERRFLERRLHEVLVDEQRV
jgi:RNA polymerase sigma-70 factor (ECF subfamily)